MLEVVRTDDGSHTLRDTQLDATYHSIHGAYTESMHVFIRAGLEPLLHYPSLRILEVGFGTGLNALLTMLQLREYQVPTSYHAIDCAPPAWEDVSRLHYPEYLKVAEAEDLLFALHHSGPSKPVCLDTFAFNLQICDMRHADIPHALDLVYFDAFSPAVQPDMWHPDILRTLAQHMAMGARLVTYCARGQFKRDLRGCGFEVQTLPGPPGKREMVRAIKERRE
jgi:tRNA U34 5-methylaminomethyl-2-thiouridine-forming methyltransferase MnmC